MSGAMELVERLTALDAFLRGEGELDGLWFGDAKKTVNGRNARYWWRRSHLPALTEAATLLKRQAQAAGKLASALAQTQWMLETIVRSNSTNFSEVRERIIANRPALREYHEAHHGN